MFNKIFKNINPRKNNKYIFVGLFLVFSFIFNISRVEASLATFGSPSSSNITHNSATLSVNMTSSGGEAIQNRGFCWNTTDSYMSYPTYNCYTTTPSSTAGVYSMNTSGIGNLTPNTTYYFKAFAVNSSGTAYSTTGTFTTALGVTGVTISGTTTVGYTLTATPAPSGADVSCVWQRSSTSGGTYSNISGATSCTYQLQSADAGNYVRVVATGVGDYSGSATSSPTSQIGLRPTISSPTSSVSGNSVTLGANITDAGIPDTITYRGFCYILDSAPNTASSGTCVDSGSTGTGVFSKEITGLSFGTTYRYAGKAINGAGTSHTTESSFTTPVARTIYFNSNDGTGTMSNISTYEGATITLPSNTFTRTDYTFAGWATSSDGPIVYEDEDDYIVGSQYFTLYAVWKADMTITINQSGVTSATNYVSPNTPQLIGYGASIPIAVLVNSSSYAVISGCGGTTKTVYDTYSGSPDDYYTASWQESGNCTVTATFYALPTLTFGAAWDGGSYNSVTMSCGGSSISSGSQVTPGTSCTATRSDAAPGTNLSEWDGPCETSSSATCTFNMPVTNFSIYFYYGLNSYTLSFNGNGSTGGSTTAQSMLYNTPTPLNLNGFTRTGYTFAGWNTLANGTGTSYANQASYTIGAGNNTLYAQWTPVYYTLDNYINTNGATGTGISCNGASCGDSYLSGTSISVTTTAVAGYNRTLSGTGSASACSGTSCTFTITSNSTITVTYTPISYNLYFYQ